MPQHRPIPGGARGNIATLPERFWACVKVVDDDSSCWLWSGFRNELGYGRINTLLAPRVSYWIATGEDPAESLVCHTCDNPPCVRPQHLFLGSHTENMRDASRKLRLPGTPAYSDELAEQIREMYAAGNSSGQIAKIVGVDRSTVTRITAGTSRKGERIVPPWARDGWRRRANQKLTDEQADEIGRRYLLGGVTYRQLADEFDISTTRVGDIIASRRRAAS